MGAKYFVNGKEVSVEEFRGDSAERARRLSDMLTSRIPPGGHACYWGTGHNSLSSGVPAHQAAEHQKWIEEQGLVGVRTEKDGTVTTESPGNRDAYLKARGLTDQTVAKGEGRNNRSPETVKKGQPKPLTRDEKEAIRRSAREITQTEEARAIFNRRGR